MEALGVIPARYGSTRFEGKVIADLLGKPLIQHVWERCQRASFLDKVIIACDDERVRDVAKGFGAEVVYTAMAHESGTDRISEVANPIDCKFVVNIQADEPLVHPSMIDSLIEILRNNKDVAMATLIKRIDDINELHDPNVVKVVVDKDGYALYFSRSAIPHRRGFEAESQIGYYKHIGLYAYTKDFLFTFNKLPESKLEKIEKLEQLRVLENGYRIKCAETRIATIGVDTPQDLEKVKAILNSKQSS